MPAVTPVFDAVVFDLDGTLIDTIPLIVASHRHALETVLGVCPYSDAELAAGIGVPLRQQMERLAPGREDELFAAYRVWNHDNTARFIKRFPGVDDVVTDLAATGVPIGVATSKMRDAVDLAFSILPPPVAYGAVVTFETTDRHKPGPEPVLAALAQLGVEPARAAYVGDAPFDLQAAHAAGCAPIAVTWGASPAADLAAERPVALCTTPAELRAALLRA